jgi:monoamine oxidase
MDNSILIIGAGAAGLMAGRELSRTGEKVIILEAREYPGGRICTENEKGFREVIESGAEFVHGQLALTLELLKEAGIDYQTVEDKFYRVKKGEWKQQDDFIEGWDDLLQKMRELQVDMTLFSFLGTCFAGEKYVLLREAVRSYAEGFDAADINTASVFALRTEWTHEEEKQYRIKGGYRQLINYLEDQCRKNGCTIHTAETVNKIEWEHNQVKIITDRGRTFMGNKVIITVPIGILQNRSDKAAITFVPAIDDYLYAAGQIGYGTVIKIILQFRQTFWKKQADEIGFILSDEPIPTWWTQLPDENPVLTGWLGGPRTKALQYADASTVILDRAMVSLSSIFKMDITELKTELIAWKIINWAADPFAKGAYSFPTLSTATAKKVLNVPVEQTLFFAGEALYEGDAPGTVEAALVTGMDVAAKIRNSLI